MEYWQRRYEAFGDDLAFKPMTLVGAMKKERRNRLLIHSGKTCTQTLAQYRLPPECLPADLNVGGTLEMDIVKWVRDRYSIQLGPVRR